MRKSKIFCLLLVAMAALVAPVFTVYYRSVETCLDCRAERMEHGALGYHWTSLSDTAFTTWYRTHRPPHVHAWTYYSGGCGYNLFGGVTYLACRSNRHPIFIVPPEMLTEFAELSDPQTLDSFFEKVHSPDPDVQQQAFQMVVTSLSKE